MTSRSSAIPEVIRWHGTLDDGQTRTESYFVFSKASDIDRYYVCPPGG